MRSVDKANKESIMNNMMLDLNVFCVHMEDGLLAMKMENLCV